MDSSSIVSIVFLVFGIPIYLFALLPAIRYKSLTSFPGNYILPVLVMQFLLLISVHGLQMIHHEVESLDNDTKYICFYTYLQQFAQIGLSIFVFGFSLTIAVAMRKPFINTHKQSRRCWGITVLAWLAYLFEIIVLTYKQNSNCQNDDFTTSINAILFGLFILDACAVFAAFIVSVLAFRLFKSNDALQKLFSSFFVFLACFFWTLGIEIVEISASKFGESRVQHALLFILRISIFVSQILIALNLFKQRVQSKYYKMMLNKLKIGDDKDENDHDSEISRARNGSFVPTFDSAFQEPLVSNTMILRGDISENTMKENVRQFEILLYCIIGASQPQPSQRTHPRKIVTELTLSQKFGIECGFAFKSQIKSYMKEGFMNLHDTDVTSGETIVRSLLPESNKNQIEFLLRQGQKVNHKYTLFTTDNRFVLKFISKRDKTHLVRRVLPKYFSYLSENQDSLLCRIHGVYRFRQIMQDDIYITLLENVTHPLESERTKLAYEFTPKHVFVFEGIRRKFMSYDDLTASRVSGSGGEKFELTSRDLELVHTRISRDVSFLTEIGCEWYSIYLGKTVLNFNEYTTLFMEQFSRVRVNRFFESMSGEDRGIFYNIAIIDFIHKDDAYYSRFPMRMAASNRKRAIIAETFLEKLFKNWFTQSQQRASCDFANEEEVELGIAARNSSNQPTTSFRTNDGSGNYHKL